MTERRDGRRILLALSLLYAAQGVPYGFASDYMPVALRQSGYSMGLIAAVSWLQLPWQLKIIWSTLADRCQASPKVLGSDRRAAWRLNIS